MKRRKNLVETHRITVSVSEDVRDFLEALGKGGGGADGKSYTEVATTLLLEKVKELMDTSVLQKRQQSLSVAKEILKKNKKRA